MPQTVLPFQYEEEKNSTGLTGLAGLPTYIEFAQVMGLPQSIGKHLKVREHSQGWRDDQVVMSLIALNLAGGDCVDDLKVLEADAGFCEVVRKVEHCGLPRKERRVLERRWRKEKRRTTPSPSAAFRYLEAFHNLEEEKRRTPGKAFIPAANEHLRGFREVNRDFVAAVQLRNSQATATLDMDATVVKTEKQEALYSYKKFKSYQPLNTYWVEQDLILHTEFRDGNVNAGFEELRGFEEALGMLPEGVEKVFLRSDGAGYQYNLLRYCETGKNKRFGRIEFAVSCTVSAEFRKAVSEVEESEWKPLWREIDGERIKTDLEWAEVCHVTNKNSYSKNDPSFRFIATREGVSQLELPVAEAQESLPFETVTMNNIRYKIHGIVTNRQIEGGELIAWCHQRCGKSEEAHSIMKEDFTGGKFPSGKFGENAAWWWTMILAMNLNAAMKQLVLGESWVARRMKAIRFHLIHLPGRIVYHARELYIRVTKGHPAFSWLLEIRRSIAALVMEPSG